MPQLIRTIAEIARERQRDVLYARVPPNSTPLFDTGWELIEARDRLIEVLSREHIPWEECMDWSPHLVVAPYDGSIFIDVPIDVADHKFQIVCSVLEYADGEPRFSDYRLYIFPLSLAFAAGNFTGRGS